MSDRSATPRLDALNKARIAYHEALVEMEGYLEGAIEEAKHGLACLYPSYAVEQTMLDVQAAGKRLTAAIRHIEEA
jgi:hypothetical protein